MKKCNKPCQACHCILEGKEIKGDKFDWKITTPANCKKRIPLIKLKQEKIKLDCDPVESKSCCLID